MTLEGPGAPPTVEEVETGAFLWINTELPLLPNTDCARALEAVLPDEGRRDILIRVRATGWASLQQQADLRQAAARLGPDFAHFDFDTNMLGTTYDDADLDDIDKAGALRLAANRLKEGTESETLSAEERAVSAGALARLYAYVKEAAE
ncbi:hypothetical protein [Hyphococcus luteus]|uniref:hypothetical protein n=1 Tax=Hyphococcus luteus TaxID=2058213 RepID=UPI001A9C633A|nr:hypothetical protein [Marinicaulis flavus]